MGKPQWRWGWNVGKSKGWGCFATHGNFRRYKIDLVKHKDKMLVRCFGADILFDTATACTIRVTGIENVENNVA